MGGEREEKKKSRFSTTFFFNLHHFFLSLTCARKKDAGGGKRLGSFLASIPSARVFKQYTFSITFFLLLIGKKGAGKIIKFLFFVEKNQIVDEKSKTQNKTASFWNRNLQAIARERSLVTNH